MFFYIAQMFNFIFIHVKIKKIRSKNLKRIITKKWKRIKITLTWVITRKRIKKFEWIKTIERKNRFWKWNVFKKFKALIWWKNYQN